MAKLQTFHRLEAFIACDKFLTKLERPVGEGEVDESEAAAEQASVSEVGSSFSRYGGAGVAKQQRRPKLVSLLLCAANLRRHGGQHYRGVKRRGLECQHR